MADMDADAGTQKLYFWSLQTILLTYEHMKTGSENRLRSGDLKPVFTEVGKKAYKNEEKKKQDQNQKEYDNI